MSQSVAITFVHPRTGETIARRSVPQGSMVLDAALDAGIDIAATCGRRGRCRSCQVKALSGEIAPPTLQDTIQLGQDAVHERFRLSCQMPAIADCTIAAVPPRSESGHQIMADVGSGIAADHALDCGVFKYAIHAKAPQDENHQTSDIEEILACLPPNTSHDVPLSVLRRLPIALRSELGRVTVTTFRNQIIDIEPGDTSERLYGIAFDVGTTSVVGSLIDLRTGEQLASVGAVNPQAVFGGDLMSRIAYAQFDERKLQTLRGRILNQLNEFIETATAQANVLPEHIYKIVIVGNTCMHHICLGIDTSYVGLAPYAPVVRDPVVVPAADLPLKRAPNARVCFLPIVAGFVGADTIAGIIATRIYESDAIRLLVDIGTNGEVVLGSKDRLLVCSAPAGPTFEGGQIKQGMRGAVGAIEKIEIGDDVQCQVIGAVPAIGICGSGLIDAAAKMLRANVIDPAGRLWREGAGTLSPNLRTRIVKQENSRAFVLVKAAESGRGEDVFLTQNDIRQLQLAKAAIYGGVMMLQKVLDAPDERIAEVMLSGGFGNYVNIESAVAIRLLPPVDLGKVNYVGNAALLGAQLALISETERLGAFDVVRRIEHVALATRLEFQDIFVDACQFSRPPQKPDAAPHIAKTAG
jgi:uncharacterized 2Fe-2S/4Fe-4S cluster protein (DUF4445 family)